MDVTPLIRADQQVIQSYNNGRFRVSGLSYESAVFVFPDKTLPWDFSKNINELAVDDFAPLFAYAHEVDVVLLGCGDEMIFIPPSFRMSLKEHGLIIDVMDTGAACRTYNVLMAEGRRVVAAMLPTGQIK